MHQPQPPAVAAARHCVHVGLTLHGSDGGANSVILSDGLANFGNAGDDATFLVAATAGRGRGAPEKTDGLKRSMRAAQRAASSVWTGACAAWRRAAAARAPGTQTG